MSDVDGGRGRRRDVRTERRWKGSDVTVAVWIVHAGSERAPSEYRHRQRIQMDETGETGAEAAWPSLGASPVCIRTCPSVQAGQASR